MGDGRSKEDGLVRHIHAYNTYMTCRVVMRVAAVDRQIPIPYVRIICRGEKEREKKFQQ